MQSFNQGKRSVRRYEVSLSATLINADNAELKLQNISLRGCRAYSNQKIPDQFSLVIDNNITISECEKVFEDEHGNLGIFFKKLDYKTIQKLRLLIFKKLKIKDQLAKTVRLSSLEMNPKQKTQTHDLIVSLMNQFTENTENFNCQDFVEKNYNSKDCHEIINFIYYNNIGIPIGFSSLFFYKFQHQGKECFVSNANAGILKEYRGYQPMGLQWMKEGVRYKLQHPLTKIFFVTRALHPSAYYGLARITGKMHPKINYFNESLIPIARKFIKAIEGDDDSISENGLVSFCDGPIKTTKKERSFWNDHPSHHVQFYIKHNPEYFKGNGLICIIPANMIELLSILIGWIKIQVYKRKKIG